MIDIEELIDSFSTKQLKMLMSVFTYNQSVDLVVEIDKELDKRIFDN